MSSGGGVFDFVFEILPVDHKILCGWFVCRTLCEYIFVCLLVCVVGVFTVNIHVCMRDSV